MPSLGPVLPCPFGRYTLVERVGAGGMATVYRALLGGEGGFEKEVAVKVVREELANDPQFRTLFLDEARVSARLAHANLVQTFDFGQVDGTWFLAMEYVRGRTLANLLRALRTRNLGPGTVRSLHLAAEVAKGLGHAHRLAGPDGTPLGLVHRDVSPQNVLVSTEGEVKLGDFGIAKAALSSHVTQPGKVRGKCAYMAPEQARGRAVDARADVFALGVVLWECLTGTALFDGGSDAEILLQVLQKEVAPPSRIRAEVPPAVDALVLRMLARDPSARPANGDEAARELAGLRLRLARSPADLDLGELERALRSGTAVQLPAAPGSLELPIEVTGPETAAPAHGPATARLPVAGDGGGGGGPSPADPSAAPRGPDGHEGAVAAGPGAREPVRSRLSVPFSDTAPADLRPAAPRGAGSPAGATVAFAAPPPAAGSPAGATGALPGPSGSAPPFPGVGPASATSPARAAAPAPPGGSATAPTLASAPTAAPMRAGSVATAPTLPETSPTAPTLPRASTTTPAPAAPPSPSPTAAPSTAAAPVPRARRLRAVALALVSAACGTGLGVAALATFPGARPPAAPGDLADPAAPVAPAATLSPAPSATPVAESGSAGVRAEPLASPLSGATPAGPTVAEAPAAEVPSSAGAGAAPRPIDPPPPARAVPGEASRAALAAHRAPVRPPRAPPSPGEAAARPVAPPAVAPAAARGVDGPPAPSGAAAPVAPTPETPTAELVVSSLSRAGGLGVRVDGGDARPLAAWRPVSLQVPPGRHRITFVSASHECLVTVELTAGRQLALHQGEDGSVRRLDGTRKQLLSCE